MKAVVRYDGSRFAGWQVQPGQRTVQGNIEWALGQIAGREVRIHGASRTDAGVHALGQVFSFLWPEEKPFDRLAFSISKMLGPEIRIESLEPAAEDFHPRKHRSSKRYAYVMSCSKLPDPFSAQFAWCIPWELDMELLRSLCRRIEGEHDFAGFQSSGASVASTVRTLYSVSLEEGGVVAPCDAGELWRLEFLGSGFLYKMVRNITGTFVDIARGYRPESWLDERMASPGPFKGMTAPARGLALMEIRYSDETPDATP